MSWQQSHPIVRLLRWVHVARFAAPASSRSAQSTVRYGGVWAAPGAGHQRGGQRPVTGARPREREWASLPRHLRRESPPSPAATARRSRPVHVPHVRPAHPRESWPGPAGLVRRRCALEAVEKVVTAQRWLFDHSQNTSNCRSVASMCCAITKRARNRYDRPQAADGKTMALCSRRKSARQQTPRTSGAPSAGWQKERD